VKVSIDHEHKQHYLVQDIKNDDFMAKAKHSWIAHSINIGDKNFVSENYKVLAQSTVGPMLATHQNSVVT
jgi:hypothetical protein